MPGPSLPGGSALLPRGTGPAVGGWDAAHSSLISSFRFLEGGSAWEGVPEGLCSTPEGGGCEEPS